MPNLSSAGKGRVKCRAIAGLGLTILFICVFPAGRCRADGDIPAYRILQKTSLAFFNAASVVVTVEGWMQEPMWHMKLKFTNFLKNVDDCKIEGRVSFSSLIPGTRFSSSSWLQAYQISGIPFSWSSAEREWKNEALKIEEERAKEVLQYSLIQSLFDINDQTADLSTLELLGKEEKSGRDCFIIQFRIDPESLRTWGTVGDLLKKVWVDSRTFLPVASRIEGKLGNRNLLQVIYYKDYDIPQEFNEPSFILAEVRRERAMLREKINELAGAAYRIRSWAGADELNDIKIEFVSRKKIKKILFSRLSDETRLAGEEKVLRWLGLIPEHADFKELIANSEISLTAGMYDPKSKTIFIGNWLEPSLAEIVCVHEVVHAFQDKIFGLKKMFDEAESLDSYLTLKAVTEGEAFVVSLEYLLNKDNESIRDGKSITSLIEKVNKGGSYLRDRIYYNLYGIGAKFIQSYLEKYSWRDIDQLYENIPVSTREILHPNDYLVRRDISSRVSQKNHKRTKTLEIPDLADWQEAYSTSLGEYLISLYLGTVLDADSCERALRGWHSDKLKIYSNGKGKNLFFLLVRWDSYRDAQEFPQYYNQWLKGKGFKYDRDNSFYLTDKEMSNFKLLDDSILIVGSRGLSRDEFKALNETIFSMTEEDDLSGGKAAGEV